MSKVSSREINRLALPAIIAGIAEPLLSLADTAIIGRMHQHATAGIAAVGLAASFFTLIIWGLAQIRTAVSALVSRYLGKNKLDEIASLVPQALLLCIGLGFLFYWLTNQFSGFIFMHLYGIKNDQPLLLKYVNDYYSIRSIGIPVALAVACLVGVFRGLQNTIWAMYVSLSGVVVNVFLDIILVYGIKGFINPMGVRGAALASLLAQLLMLAIATYYLLRKTPFRLYFSGGMNKEFPTMLRMAANMLIRTIALNITFFLGNRFANKYGEAQLAAFNILVNIWLFSSFFIDGFSNAGNAISGKLLGQRDYHKLVNLSRSLLKINLLIATGLSLCYALGYFFTGHFFSHDPQVIHVFNQLYWLVIIAQPLNAIAFTFDGIFKGLGETGFLRNTLLIATFLIFIPLIYLNNYLLHLAQYGIWLAFIGWMLYRGGSLVWQFRRKYHPLVIKTD